MTRSPIRSVAVAAALAAVTLLSAPVLAEEPAAAAEEPAFAYTVVEQNARIPFGADDIDSFRVGRDGSLLLRARRNDWYRAVLWAPCQRDLRWEHEIAVGDRNASSFDRFSTIIVNGNRCAIETLDRIEDPRIAERAADAAEEAAQATES